MGLPERSIAKLIDHLSTTWKSTDCVLCGHDDWEVHGHLTLQLGPKQGTSPPHGEYLPCAAVVCKKCGNTYIINLFTAGVARRT